MTDLEVNKIIAEYMGVELGMPMNLDELSVRQKKEYAPYTNSLDALIPVWEKLNSLPSFYWAFSWFDVSENALECQIKNYKNEIVSQAYSGKMSLQKAASHATAACIKRTKYLKLYNRHSKALT